MQNTNPSGESYWKGPFDSGNPIVGKEPLNSLLIFASPFPAPDMVPDPAAPTSLVVEPGLVTGLNTTDKNTVIFNPGVYWFSSVAHAALSSNVDWVYFAPGAYVKGAVYFNTIAPTMKATGHGVLSGEQYVYQVSGSLYSSDLFSPDLTKQRNADSERRVGQHRRGLPQRTIQPERPENVERRQFRRPADLHPQRRHHQRPTLQLHGLHRKPRHALDAGVRLQASRRILRTNGRVGELSRVHHARRLLPLQRRHDQDILLRRHHPTHHRVERHDGTNGATRLGVPHPGKHTRRRRRHHPLPLSLQQQPSVPRRPQPTLLPTGRNLPVHRRRGQPRPQRDAFQLPLRRHQRRSLPHLPARDVRQLPDAGFLDRGILACRHSHRAE